MLKKSIWLNDREYNFIFFNEIVRKILSEFLSELERCNFLDKADLSKRIFKRILRHYVLEEVLKCYSMVEIGKINAIIVQTPKLSVYSGGVLDDNKFIDEVLHVLDTSKRKIPILIKKYNNNSDFIGFLGTGEGVEFVNGLLNDKERLRKSTYTFKDFKEFAIKNKLKYIVEYVLPDPQFKKLFVS